jgi:hypothetical protein
MPSVRKSGSWPADFGSRFTDEHFGMFIQKAIGMSPTLFLIQMHSKIYLLLKV